MITVDALNSAYSSVDGVLFDQNQTKLIQFPPSKAGNYTIPNTVTQIEYRGFARCARLTSVTVGNGVTTIGSGAFQSCSNLTTATIGNNVNTIASRAFLCCPSLNGLHFKGNAPSLGFDVFTGDNNATVYYLPGTSGWSATFGGLPSTVWQPMIQINDASFGVRTNQFGFKITWADEMVVLVEVSTSLANPVWSPVGTNTLTGGTSYFSDPVWTNYPGRFYRLRSP